MTIAEFLSVRNHPLQSIIHHKHYNFCVRYISHFIRQSIKEQLFKIYHQGFKPIKTQSKLFAHDLQNHTMIRILFKTLTCILLTLYTDCVPTLRIAATLFIRWLKTQCHEISDPRFFYQSTPLRALIHGLKSFRIWHMTPSRNSIQKSPKSASAEADFLAGVPL
jgi:hypothetical protein